MKKTAFIFLAISTAITACNKNENLAKPEIHVESVTPSLTSTELCEHTVDNAIIVHPTDTITFSFHLVGQNELSQLKIDIHENTDCHEHDHEHKSAPFETIIIKNVSGNEAHLVEKVAIPEDAKASNYHIDIRLLDKMGNEANELEYHLIIEEAH